MGWNGLVETVRLSITPSANRNSYRVARLVGMLTQGSVLRPQPWAGESQLRQSCCCLRSGLLRVLLTIYCVREGDEINTKSRGGGWRLRLGVDGGADRLHHPHRHAVHDAIHHDGKKSGLWPFKKSAVGGKKTAAHVFLIIMHSITPMGNLFFPGGSRAFFTAVGGLFVFVAFQPAHGQARRGGAVNIRELALVDISAPLWRMGRSPEKLQIFLCYFFFAFCLVWELTSPCSKSPSPCPPQGARVHSSCV